MSHSTKPETIFAARKWHRCDWCGELIDKGCSYVRWGWFNSGDAATVKVHPACYDAIQECDPQDVNGGWTAGSNPRGCNCGFDPGCERCEEKKKKCRKCGGEMAPGIAMQQTWVGGMPDFPGDEAGARGQTVHTGGPGKLTDCSAKCKLCGWSVW